MNTLMKTEELIRRLELNTTQYEKLTLEVLGLVEASEAFLRGLADKRYLIDKKILAEPKEYPNESKREQARRELLGTDPLYVQLAQDEAGIEINIRRKKTELQVIEFQTGTFKRILEYRASESKEVRDGK